MPEEPTESLAAIPPGTEIVIVRNLLAGSSSRDESDPLTPGGRWRCHRNVSAAVFLINGDGRTVGVHPDEARFLQVRRRTG